MPRMLVEGAPQKQSTTPAQTTIGAAAVLIAESNAKRKGFIIQNTGTSIIKVNLGPVDPTQTVYHVALKGGTAADDGLGAAYFDDAWTGQIRAISSAAGGTFVLTEFASGGPDWNASEDLY